MHSDVTLSDICDKPTAIIRQMQLENVDNNTIRHGPNIENYDLCIV